MTSVTLRLAPIPLTDEQFLEVCRLNPDWKFEQTAQGELVIVSPTGGETGNVNFELSAEFAIWNRQTKLGVGFDSSTCFQLPNGAKRAPDVAWIRQDRWNALTPAERIKFPPIAPDFVLELLSPSDSLSETQAKMQEYIENGVKLGWLIDRSTRCIEIYRPNQPIEVLRSPATLAGEGVLPGFTLSLAAIW
jgi:Uma2 family endonuclease